MPTDTRKSTKTALLDAAERAARIKGIDGFSYGDLANAVGIRKPSIHHHFPTKAALSVALMQRYFDRVETACREIDASGGTGGAKILGLISVYRDALDQGRCLCLCVAFSASRDSLPPDVINQITGFRQMIIQWLATWFAKGKTDGSIAAVKDPLPEAAAALALLEGAQLAARAEERMYAFDDALILLRGRVSESG